MMRSALFHLSPESWLGKKLDADARLVVSPKVALSFECQPTKGAEASKELKERLVSEQGVIDGLPDVGFALRADRIEALRGKEFGDGQCPSVDLCIRTRESLILVECKYKALPETSIVKSVKVFNSTVARKFDAAQSFYRHEGARQFFDERIVLFNGDSVDKVLSMFRRLQLENEGRPLRQYVIVDTNGFWSRYSHLFDGEGEVAENE